MFRLINGVTVRGRVSPTPKLRSQSPFLISSPISRSIYVPLGFLTNPFEARGKMARVVPRRGCCPRLSRIVASLLTSVEKDRGRRWELNVLGKASTYTVAATAKRKSVNGGKRIKHRRERNRSISFLNHTRMRTRMCCGSPAYKLDMTHR